MSRYCLFTFNPHPSDTKEFVQEMQSLLQPLLQKTKQYIFVREKKGKPEEHIHLLFTSDTINEKDKIKQKIENKGIKQFIKKIQNSNTFSYILLAKSTCNRSTIFFFTNITNILHMIFLSIFD